MHMFDPEQPLHGRLRDRRRQPAARRRHGARLRLPGHRRGHRLRVRRRRRPTRARSARRSTSPRCGSCRWSSWSPTTSSAWAPRSSATRAVTDLHRRGEGFGVPGMRCDGMDVVDTYEVMREAIRRAREERQPMLVEAVTYRFRGHSMADPEEYRTKEQVAEWRKRDPITTFADRLVAEGVLEEGEREELDAAAIKRIDEAVAFADELRLPAARVALRPHLRARRPGQGLVLGRRALGRRAPRRGRARMAAERARAGGAYDEARRAGRRRGRRPREGRRRGPGRG